MNKILSVSALLGGMLLAASCSQQVQPVKKAGRSPVYVGKVERVYPPPQLCADCPGRYRV